MTRPLEVDSIIERGTAKGLDASILGRRLRDLRKSRKWTQGTLSRHTGIATSTISKVENNQLSPSFETLLRLAEGLGVELADLLASRPENEALTRRVITRQGEGDLHETPSYVYELLCTDLKSKRMHPLIARLKAHSVTEFGELLHHPGEELFFVLQGQVELHTEHYKPVVLSCGDCVYLDSTMGHGCISVGRDEAMVFWVSMVS